MAVTHPMVFRDAVVDAVGVNFGANFYSLHTADPGTTGASELTTTRGNATFPAAGGDGTATNTGAEITVPAGVYTHWGRWSAVTGGVFMDGGTLPASENYGVGGFYILTMVISQAAAGA